MWDFLNIIELFWIYKVLLTRFYRQYFVTNYELPKSWFFQVLDLDEVMTLKQLFFLAIYFKLEKNH